MTDDITNVDIDLSDASASRPLLGKQTLRCHIGQPSIERTNAGLRRALVPLVLEEPGMDIKSKVVHPGFQVTHSFLLDASGGWDLKRAQEEFLRTKMAALGVDEAAAKAAPNDMSAWAGHEVLASFAVKDGKEGPMQNVTRLAAVKTQSVPY